MKRTDTRLQTLDECVYGQWKYFLRVVKKVKKVTSGNLEVLFSRLFARWLYLKICICIYPIKFY